MAVFKYLNPNYVEGGSEPKWIKIPLTGSAVITPVQSTGQSEVDIMSQKAVTDALNTKQNTLVSGTNIKTINGQSLVGTGNITIESDATFNNGHNAVSSVAGIPVSKRLVIATISNNGSFTLASTPADGREIHVIVHNTNSSDIEITMPSGSNYVKMSGDTLTVAGNSYADINVISDGTNMYIRAL